MSDLVKRRKAEFEQYERPQYNGKMKPWRVVLITEWLAPLAKAKCRGLLDVGCGCGETRFMAQALNWRNGWRGCEVVASVCDENDVDLIDGAHQLPYPNRSFDVVTCNDVLEHVLEEDVPASLRELSRVARKHILLGISQKAGKHHPTIKPTEWWLARIGENMRGTPTIIYADRIPKIKQPYLWVDIRC